MSKQKRPGRSPEQAPDKETPAPGVEASVPEQDALGNLGFQARIDGDGQDAQPGLDVVRDVAFPMVERAILALELTPPDSSRMDRFVEILEASHLPDDRKQLLVDKLQTDRAAAHGIEQAVERWFGTDGPDVRASVSGALDAVWAALENGTGAGSEWQVGDRAVSLSEGAVDGSVADRAEALVSDLADGFATQVSGPSVRGFCRDVYLAIVFDEEEEEEDYSTWEVGVEQE